MNTHQRRLAAALARRRAIAEQNWKNFCAALGYPDPDTITQERAIWQASDAQARITSSRICSASSTRKVAVTSPEIRQIVDNFYDQHLLLPEEWTARQREDYLETQAANISRQVADLAATMGERAVKDWKRRHGQAPDYLTRVGLLNTARSQAMETVLTNELYEQIAAEEDPPQEPPSSLPDRHHLPWEQRWTNSQHRREPTDQIEELVATVWPVPDFSAVFRVKAGYLLAARDEDQLPLPSHRDDPLAATLAPLIYADLRRDGLPER